MSDIVLIPLVAFVGFVAGAVAMYGVASQAFDRDEAFWEAQTVPTWTTTTYPTDDDGSTVDHAEGD